MSQRTPIFMHDNRGSVCRNSLELQGCTCPFISTDDHIFVSRGADWSGVLDRIESNRAAGKTTMLSSSCRVPRTVVWRLSYDASNVISPHVYPGNTRSLSILSDLAVLSDKCGIYLMPVIGPVVPGTTIIYSILQAIDIVHRYANMCIMINFYTDIRGGQISGCDLTKMVSRGDIITCSGEYTSKVMEPIRAYCSPRNIRVHECGCC